MRALLLIVMCVWLGVGCGGEREPGLGGAGTAGAGSNAGSGGVAGEAGTIAGGDAGVFDARVDHDSAIDSTRDADTTDHDAASADARVNVDASPMHDAGASAGDGHGCFGGEVCVLVQGTAPLCVPAGSDVPALCTNVGLGCGTSGGQCSTLVNSNLGNRCTRACFLF